MQYREILKIIGSYLFLFAAILVVPFVLAAYYQFMTDPLDHPQPHSTAAFLSTIVVCLSGGALCYFISRSSKAALYRREALAATVLVWFLTPAVGALPFIFSGTLERFDQAYLEMTSGLTTSGASVIEAKQYDEAGKEISIHKTLCSFPKRDTYSFFGNITPIKDLKTGQMLEGVEAIGKGLLFWRALIQWLGGMGIIVLFVAFLPALGVGGKFLFQTESSGVTKEGFTPRIKETAMQLWKIYFGLTFLQIILLLVTNAEMPLFDSIAVTFATISTGGLGIHDHSIAYYNNSFTEWIVTLFMLLGGINFALYYHIIKGKIYKVFEPEFIVYILIVICFSLFAAWYVYGSPKINFDGKDTGVYSFEEAIRYGFFQLISTQTSTGFFTANYDAWPMAIQALMLISMFLGGMAGSTAGGIKIIRVYTLFLVAKNRIESIFRPKTVKVLRIGQKEIDQDIANSILVFFFIAILFSILGIFLYVLDNIDSETAVSLSVAMVNNTGLGFRMNGPTGSLAFLSPFSAYFSSFLMILGRLEFYAVLVILMPAFWKES